MELTPIEKNSKNEIPNPKSQNDKRVSFGIWNWGLGVGKPVAAVILFFFLVSFIAGSDTHRISGTWKEWWGVGQTTDVHYHDIFFIQSDPVHNCELSAERDNYNFCRVRFHDGELTFRLINTDANDTLPYSLKMSDDGKTLRGTAISVYGQKRNIVWEKVNTEVRP